MKDIVTITIFVEPNSFLTMINVLQILKGLHPDNEYVFQPKDIEFSEVMISNFIWLNIPVDLYVKFKYAYHKLSK